MLKRYRSWDEQTRSSLDRPFLGTSYKHNASNDEAEKLGSFNAHIQTHKPTHPRANARITNFIIVNKFSTDLEDCLTPKIVKRVKYNKGKMNSIGQQQSYANMAINPSKHDQLSRFKFNNFLSCAPSKFENDLLFEEKGRKVRQHLHWFQSEILEIVKRKLPVVASGQRPWRWKFIDLLPRVISNLCKINIRNDNIGKFSLGAVLMQISRSNVQEETNFLKKSFDSYFSAENG